MPGLQLGQEPAEVNIGARVRQIEPDFFMAECFAKNRNACVLTAACDLKGVLRSATVAYLAVLDSVTLDKLIKRDAA